MGNRDDLLAGALHCLLEQGYAATTARAIVARSGTSLAAIGYHFGSTEALLHEAIGEGFRRWRARMAAVLERRAGEAPERLVAAIGEELTRLFAEERPLFHVFLEAVALADRSEDVQRQAAAGYAEDRAGVAALVAAIRGEARGDDAVLASVLLAVVDGLLIQHLLSPADAPSPQEVLELLAPLIVA